LGDVAQPNELINELIDMGLENKKSLVEKNIWMLMIIFLTEFEFHTGIRKQNQRIMCDYISKRKKRSVRLKTLILFRYFESCGRLEKNRKD